MNPQIAYLLNLSIQQIESKRLNDAERTLNQIIKAQPKNADALCFLSVVFAYKLEYENALNYINRSIKLNPKNSIAFSNKGNILKELGRHSEASLAYEKAIHIDSKNPEAFNNLGNLQQDLGYYSQAIASYENAIKLAPSYSEAYSNKGNALEKLGLYDESLAMYEKALKISPQYIDAWLNRSFTLNKLKRFQDALNSCDAAIAIDPNYFLAWVNKGSILSENGFHEKSLHFYDQAILLNGESEIAWASRGSSLVQLKRYEEALFSYEKAYSINGNLGYLIGDIVDLKLLIASWPGLDDYIQKMVNNLQQGKKVARPLQFCRAVDSLQLGLLVATKWVSDKFPPRNIFSEAKKSQHQKIRLGYFSADFRNHPVSSLTAEIFELHDREKFEVYAFSVKGSGCEDEIRNRLISSFDKFVDLEGKTDLEAAKIAREFEIDIAIDLGGHTEFGPTGIMSHRVAPIQVNYLGYPGTMGADYIDYIIADKVLIPQDLQKFYSEKVVYMPDTYMVDDSKRLPSKYSFKKKDFDLPENKFIFCCFNNSYKFNKKMIDSWCRILNAVPESLLWISENNEIFKKNLVAEFSTVGIKNDRIIFAKRLDTISDHLARLSLADLFLDTHPYNAHTTAVDALKSNVPVLTCLGKTFAGRVSGSLLRAIGLPELITNSLEEYEDAAIKLASKPNKIQALKAMLAQNKDKEALFNTPQFVKNLELAYMQMQQRSAKGQSVDNIFVGQI